eukprot:TRINITY_DN1795_c0_g1_i1.p1 TRINITY_DN1795_c0_g1~~TRINITY_DN1795_c0_g1_i1.p1  ORF type:complete len:184 (+),score=32.06 TRINITY_DN1795_c0_g1_i1:54-554(+)
MEGFTTSRLQLCKWGGLNISEDQWLDALMELLTDEVTKELPPGWQGMDRATLKKWSAEREQDGVMLAAKNIETQDVVGLMFLFNSSSGSGCTTHIGYLVGERHQGKGYATEIIKGLISSIPKPVTLLAGVSSCNKPSMNVLTKCGFKSRPASPDSPPDTDFFELSL